MAARLGAGAITAFWRTTRWQIEGQDHVDALRADGRGFVAAFWHGRLLFTPFCVPQGQRTLAVISNSRDGDLIGAIVARFGVEAVRGSSNDPRKTDRDKGGREAFGAALAALQAGAVVGITPDGPRGPRMRAQPGVAVLSAAAQVPVLPLAVSTRRGRLLGSWDRFLMPRPFDRGVVLYDAPLPPPPRGDEAALEAHRLAIEARLNALTAEADRRMGRGTVEPA